MSGSDHDRHRLLALLDGQMQLCRQTAARAPKAVVVRLRADTAGRLLLQIPLFRAPSACWWARHTVESTLMSQVMSSLASDWACSSNGDYIKAKGVAFGAGAGSFTARVASGTSGGRVELHLDSPTGPTVGTCTVSGTGGWQTCRTVSCPVTGATGTHDLYLRFAGGSGYLFNMNWWQFTTGQSTFSSTAVAQHSGHCLDDPNQSTTDGTQYRQYTCGAGEEQRFDFRPVPGVADTYSLVNRHSGKCLDIRGVSTANGEAVHQWTCHGGTNQQFTLRHVAANDYQLVALHSGKCVDVSGISTAVGALVHQWTCDSASALATKKNQVWRLTGKS
ncbi:RICIN domain-containing protein [Streptomyces sp. NPDC099050]|uniref:RICIN domain-containing protein n=1 Tax=Streptomyces sp. NPDC099050 TaxID=3366100 RepID=UPI0038231F8C